MVEEAAVTIVTVSMAVIVVVGMLMTVQVLVSALREELDIVDRTVSKALAKMFDCAVQTFGVRQAIVLDSTVGAAAHSFSLC